MLANMPAIGMKIHARQWNFSIVVTLAITVNVVIKMRINCVLFWENWHLRLN